MISGGQIDKSMNEFAKPFPFPLFTDFLSKNVMIPSHITKEKALMIQLKQVKHN